VNFKCQKSITGNSAASNETECAYTSECDLNHQNRTEAADQELKRRIDEELDEALKQTFPASDPIALPLFNERDKSMS
jgi:hypothetical protein